MNNLINVVNRVHRDIKPANILIDRHGEIKLSDFGLARDTSDKSMLSTSIAGTQRYFSPELGEGESQSEKSDVWSFGVVLIELAYGRDSLSDSKIVSLKPKKIKSKFIKRGGYSKEMIKFLSRCFERKRCDRAKVIDLLQDNWLSDAKILKNIVIPSTATKSGIYKEFIMIYIDEEYSVFYYSITNFV